MSTAEQTIEKKVVLPTIPDPTEPSAQAEKMGDDAAVKEPNTVGDKATRGAKFPSPIDLDSFPPSFASIAFFSISALFPGAFYRSTVLPPTP